MNSLQQITGHSPALTSEKEDTGDPPLLQDTGDPPQIVFAIIITNAPCEGQSEQHSLFVFIGILNVLLSHFYRFDKNILTRCGKSQTELKVQ